MAALPRITVDGTTGGAVSVNRSTDRVEVWLRGDTVRIFFAFNAPAVLNQGIYIDPGEVMVIVRPRAQADIYAVAASSTFLYVETVES